MDWNLIYGLLTIVALVLFFVYVKPQSFNLYSEIKLALLIAGKSFRYDKVVTIADILLTIVKQLEELDETDNTEKQAIAIQLAGQEILQKLGIEIEEEILGLIVDVAVAYIPATNK